MKLSNIDLSSNQSSLKIDGIPWGCLHTDIPRLKEGGVGAQFWSVFAPTSLSGSAAVQVTMEQIDLVHQLCDKYPETFEMAYTAQEVRDIFAAGKIPAGPGWADPAVNADGSFAHEAPLGGLAPFGVEVVKEMNRIGMIVDISHVHEATMIAALDCSRAPVMFSHSSTRALCAHPRDVPDAVLERLKTNGGLVMVVFLSKFVAGEFWVRGGQVGATLLEVADHIDHAVKIAGIDHVGIGGDFDGVSLFAKGCEDVTCYVMLTAELLYRGYTKEQLGKILGLNAIRVMEECEEVAKKMKEDGELANEAHFGEELYETNIMKGIK
ncbi:hypothetical protein TL16_g02241 [Triparma laevis f. inornata]|uniref:Dipeptidase n=1 Tax=Triparma laevis f. inornata TaxID=1714386 RepID=A0A9W6ZPL6_9STRA|nr:hypothetical protein TL16_g02241 [Triparma laevis f. inornata]